MVDLSRVESPMGQTVFQLSNPLSDRERRAIEAEMRRDPPTFGEAVDAAVTLESSLKALSNIIEEQALTYDPEYRLPEAKDLVRTLEENNIPPEYLYLYQGAFTDIRNQEHFDLVIERMKEERAAEETLGQWGWAGAGIRIGTAILDPASLGLAALTSPLVVANYKLTRIARALRMAGLAAGENVALESLLWKSQETRDVEDIGYAALAGLILGGAIGGLTRGDYTKLRQAARVAADEIDAKVLREAGVEPPPVKPAEPPARAPEAAPRVPLHVAEGADEVPAPKKAVESRAKIETPAESPSAVRLQELLSRRAHVETAAQQAETLGARYQQALDFMGSYSRALRLNAMDPGRHPASAIPDVETLPEDVKRVVADYLEEGEVRLSKEDREFMRGLVEEAKREVEVLGKERASLIEEITKEEEAVAKHRAAGAEATRMEQVSRPLVEDDDLSPGLKQEIEENAPTTKFAKARYSIMARVKSNRNPYIRWPGAKMAEDSVGSTRGVTEIGASEIADNLQRRMHARFYREVVPAFKEWLQAQNVGAFGRWTRRREFFEQVADAIRTGDAASPAVAKAANVLRGIFRDYLAEAKRWGVRGFTDVAEVDDYLPRIYDMTRIREFDARYGTGQVEHFIARAMMQAQDWLDEADALKIARAYYKRLRRLAAGMDATAFHGMNLDNREFMRELLAEADLDPDYIETILISLERRVDPAAKRGAPSRGKARLLLDENFEAALTHGPQSTTPGAIDQVRFSTLFENDAEKLFHLYSRQMSGYIGLAQKDIKSRADFDRWITRARAYGYEHGIEEETEQGVEQLEFLWKAIVGIPIEGDPASWVVQAGRRLRDINYIGVMNQVGFAQLTEISNLIFLGGARNLLTQIPELGRMFKRLPTGKLTDDLAAELEDWVGLGTDWLRNVSVTRWDELDYISIRQGGTRYGKRGGTALGKLDMALDVGKRATTILSGMAPVNTVLTRLTMRSVAQTFANIAFSASKANLRRIASLGLDEEMLGRIKTMMKSHGEVSDSLVVKRKLRKLNLERWEDLEARDALVHAIFRMSRRIIQENDVGATHMWFHSTTGKIVTQFRSFMLQAYEKQFLHGVAMHDWRTFMAWSSAMVIGGMVYAGQTYLNSLGRPDQEKFLADRLSAEGLVRGVANRAAFFSLFPMAADTVWMWGADEEPIFSYGRTTGLPSDIILGNPSFALAAAAYRGTGGVFKAITQEDYQFSQQDARNLWYMMPFHNLLGLQNAFQALHRELPAKSRTEY